MSRQPRTPLKFRGSIPEEEGQNVEGQIAGSATAVELRGVLPRTTR